MSARLLLIASVGLGAIAAALTASAQMIEDPFEPHPGWEGQIMGNVFGGTGQSGSASPLDTSALRPTSTAQGWRVDLATGFSLATPAVVGGTVYIGGGFGSHEFYAFDAATGTPRWGITVSDDGPTTAVVDRNRVIFNTESCTLFVVDAQDGRHIWSRWLGDPLMSQPATADGRVYMVYPAAESHHLAAFDLDSGAGLWDMPVDTDAITAPVVVDGAVYLSSMAGTLYRFDAATGAQRWARHEGVTSAPWVRGDRIFASLHDETDADTAGPVEGLGYLDGSSGERAQDRGRTFARRAAPWLSREVQDRSSYGGANVSQDDGVGFKPEGEKQDMEPEILPANQGGSPGGAPAMARIEAAAGNIGQSTVSGLWEYQGSRPTLVGNLAIATVGTHVEAVDIETGEVRWSHALAGDIETTGGHLGTPPAYAGGRVWVATTSGRLEALDPATGNVLWSAEVGAPVRAQPAIVDGRVYVGTTTGQIVMIDSGHRGEGSWPMWGGSPAHQ